MFGAGQFEIMLVFCVLVVIPAYVIFHFIRKFW